MDVAYRERVLTTSEIELAAVFLLFGATLRKSLPVEWVDEFRDKEHFLAWRRDPGSNPIDKERIFFNFDDQGIPSSEIHKAFNEPDAEEKFTDAFNAAGIEPEHAKELLALHSGAVASACCQVIKSLKYLIERRRSVPHDSKWNLIRGQKAGRSVRFGKNATKELMAEFLEKL